ncbi:hypothetical protein [Streptomyces inhibens]|uniref:hypothetical protein n=1 Tax=Streptomyces inhibens TaxID=2293571 RepID=UPI000FFB151F|nr:hypothetical protein [Streptomyces inhibens]
MAEKVGRDGRLMACQGLLPPGLAHGAEVFLTASMLDNERSLSALVLAQARAPPAFSAMAEFSRQGAYGALSIMAGFLRSGGFCEHF